MRVQIGRSSHFPAVQAAQPQPASTRSNGELPRSEPAGRVEPRDVFTPHEPGRKLVELGGAQLEGFSTLSTSGKTGTGSSNGQRLEVEDHGS